MNDNNECSVKKASQKLYNILKKLLWEKNNKFCDQNINN